MPIILQVELFEFDAVQLGKLSHAVVGHDGDGPGEGWFVDDILVQESDQKDLQWKFPCRKYVSIPLLFTILLTNLILVKIF